MNWFLIVYDRALGRSLLCERYPADAHAIAWEKRSELTLHHLREPQIEVVLIGADSEEVVRGTHARYFYAAGTVVTDAVLAA